jgi:hypothetical protein
VPVHSLIIIVIAAAEAPACLPRVGDATAAGLRSCSSDCGAGRNMAAAAAKATTAAAAAAAATTAASANACVPCPASAACREASRHCDGRDWDATAAPHDQTTKQPLVCSADVLLLLPVRLLWPWGGGGTQCP